MVLALAIFAPQSDDQALVDAVEGITVGQLLAFVLFVGAMITIVRKVIPFFSKIGDFLEDWAGSPARPGVEAKPGVMERLSILEEASKKTVKQIEPNSGKSLYDKVDKLVQQTGVDNVDSSS